MTRLARLALAVVAIPFGVLAYRVQVRDFHSPHERAAAVVAVAYAFLLAGLVVWTRRPGNRLGPLMTAAAFALLARQLRYSGDPLVFTVFFALGELGYALVAHCALGYSSGRVVGRGERVLVRAGYATVLLFPLATLLVYDGSRPLPSLGAIGRDSVTNVVADAGAAELLQKTEVVVFYGVLATLYIVLIVRRLVTAMPRARRILSPLLLAAVAIALRAVFACVFTFVDRPFAEDYLFWWQIGAFLALPLAFLWGLLQARLARAGVGDLVVALERTPPHELSGAIGRALGDPTLELAFWLPERGQYVDAASKPMTLPTHDERRAATLLGHDGEPVAAVIHDRSLLDEPRLVEAAGAAARLALENARLHAETRAQLAQVQESRARIVAAADEERPRVERDVHDGAQQRLVALALQVRSAERRLGGKLEPEVETLLAATVSELQVAVEELRELARGLHPAILTEEGLGAALEALADRTPCPVSVAALPDRFPAQVEATAYFVACEALANVAKHARATRASVSAARRDGLLVVAVEDDGVGGAREERGSGLRGLADRVEALGGRLRVASAPGSGTRVVAEIPCSPGA